MYVQCVNREVHHPKHFYSNQVFISSKLGPRWTFWLGTQFQTGGAVFEGTSGKSPSRTPKAPGACKIRRGCKTVGDSHCDGPVQR